MAAFSYKHYPFVLDSLFVPNTSNKMPGLLAEESINTTCFSPIYSPKFLQDLPLHVQIHESGSLNNSRKVHLTYTEPCVTVKQKTDSSSMVFELETGDQVTDQVVTPMEKKRENIDFKAEREGRGEKRRKHSDTLESAEKKKLKADKKEKKKVLEEAPTGYVHVRARRGQATDSHSLAERVRREKISERMKCLQSLVPGCDKITGKALILDEIINYVQSLQNQVEFLEMMLASANPNPMFNDFKVDLDTKTLASEKLSSLEPPLPSVPQSSSTQFKFFAEATTTSTSLLLQGEQRFDVISEDSAHLLWDIDEQTQKLVNQDGFSNLCSF